MTISLPAMAAWADAAVVPPFAVVSPFAAKLSIALDTRSKPVTRCPAVTRLAAIGSHIAEPDKSDRRHLWSPSGPAASGEAKFTIADRREIRVDNIVGHLAERCRLPARLLILVDQRGLHPFVKVVPCHHMLGQAVFEGKRRVEIVTRPDRELAQC